MLDLAHFVRHRDNGLSEIQLALEAIGRRPDIAAAEGAVRSLPGVRWVRFNLERLRVTVRWMRATPIRLAFWTRSSRPGFVPIRSRSEPRPMGRRHARRAGS